jgi:hypothetical protein
MNAGERRLVSLAAALIGDSAALSITESKLVARAHPIDAHHIAGARVQILAGQDLLGAEFCSLRSAPQRRQNGATYTPTPLSMPWRNGLMVKSRRRLAWSTLGRAPDGF